MRSEDSSREDKMEEVVSNYYISFRQEQEMGMREIFNGMAGRTLLYTRF